MWEIFIFNDMYPECMGSPFVTNMSSQDPMKIIFIPEVKYGIYLIGKNNRKIKDIVLF